jgi:uncharacterized repeat protein (TIGR03837 family)
MRFINSVVAYDSDLMMDQSPPLLRWDIFCRVIDNLGDAGVCLRLAADLASRGLQVCLYIDQPAVLADLMGNATYSKSLSIRLWPDATQSFSASEVADVVIEAFACDPPSAYISAMAQSDKPPVWINLEYLSAEAWVEESHGLPSPHPRYALTKYFYFPGFTPATGGLLREPGLIEQLARFDTVHSPSTSDAQRVFMFGYAQPRITEWLNALSSQEMPTLLGIAPCPIQQQVTYWLATHAETKELTVVHQPFVPQVAFDALLATYDFLFVRGEDSFVRAQWVAKPFVWQIYPQEDAIHLIKLKAFYDRYLDQGVLTEEQRSIYWQFVSAWNLGHEASNEPVLANTWPKLVEIYPLLLENARVWRNQLLKQRDLVSQLRDFVGHLVK